MTQLERIAAIALAALIVVGLLVYFLIDTGKQVEQGKTAEVRAEQAEAETDLSKRNGRIAKRNATDTTNVQNAARRELDEIRNDAGGDDVLLDAGELREWNKPLGAALASRPGPAGRMPAVAAGGDKRDETRPAREQDRVEAGVRDVRPAPPRPVTADQESPRRGVEERLKQLFGDS